MLHALLFRGWAWKPAVSPVSAMEGGPSLAAVCCSCKLNAEIKNAIEGCVRGGKILFTPLLSVLTDVSL